MASLLTFTLASDTELPVAVQSTGIYRAQAYTTNTASLTGNDFGEDFMIESMIQTNWDILMDNTMNTIYILVSICQTIYNFIFQLKWQ